jgi:mycothiol maleylpyruvate isomerase-like protein
MAGEASASALEAGFVEMAGIVRALHGDWSAPVSGYDGWTCHELLAHLSSTQASLPDVAMSATAPPRPDAQPFDADRWNRGQLRRRAEMDSQEMFNEFDSGTTRLVEALTDMELDKPVTIGAYAGLPLGQAMAQMLEHQRHHLDDLRRALHAHPES